MLTATATCSSFSLLTRAEAKGRSSGSVDQQDSASSLGGVEGRQEWGWGGVGGRAEGGATTEVRGGGAGMMSHR